MSERDQTIFLRDIVDSISKIERYVSGMNYEEFAKNEMAIDAVIRNFEVIGEAASHVPENLKCAYQSIPWDKMMAMRNLLIHEYFGVDTETVWKTAKESLPHLKAAIGKILSQ
jgi:uncharacterized protein with HEPN domain